MNLLARIVLIMTVVLTLLAHLTDGMHPLSGIASEWKVGIGLSMGLVAMLAATGALVIGIFKITGATFRQSSYSHPNEANPPFKTGTTWRRSLRQGPRRKGIEIRRGHASDVVTRAECSRPTGSCSVAYFRLDGEPAKMICQALEPYSRSPLPPPFLEGDELIIAGRMDRASGRFNAISSRLVRQRETIDHNPIAIMVAGGLTFAGFGFYPVIIMAMTVAKFPIDKIVPLVMGNSGAVFIAVTMSCVGVLGLLVLVHASRLLWVRRMLAAAANETNMVQRV
jgi:hypothetical protein